ncbi:hypothetical protein H257_11396 [Aphanomyces astaci]|uniref:DDE-1 domain-containing protein n=1 Tax=Aphanomyces astaci TaxID=112090 RepID=W4G502_APHAT|nr:hypothetical protein H257_11396 [Aphanomyces astaci]ETV74094.1 hypothetical protein H257_11396 [Aphanomyces astaci]|eukprot:XP_009836607.1 hypothetical protein H257_11396 [Aphanomyces astaci]
MTRITYPIAFKLEALKLLETLSDYKVAVLLNVARRTLRNWQKQRNELLAYKGKQEAPEVQYINDLRDAERALTTMHIINWIKRNQRTWLLDYLSTKAAGSGYKAFLQLLRRETCELRDEFALEFHRSHSAHSKECTYNVDETGFYYDMPPHYIWAVRGGSSKISAGEKHSMRMTAVLTARTARRTHRNKRGAYLPRRTLLRRPREGLDARVWKQFLRSVLHDIEECSVILVDNFEAHVSEESTKIVQEELTCVPCHRMRRLCASPWTWVSLRPSSVTYVSCGCMRR